MEKFLKITLSDAPYLIPIKEILHVEIGADTKIQILYRGAAFGVTAAASTVFGLEITATTATTTAKTKEQLVSFVAAMGKALETSWNKAVYDITNELTYAVTAIDQIEEDWSA